MTDISRRGFLGGAAACAAVAAMPFPALPSLPPIFEDVIGVYNGIPIRAVFDIDLCEALTTGTARWARLDDGSFRVYPMQEVLSDGR